MPGTVWRGPLAPEAWWASAAALISVMSNGRGPNARLRKRTDSQSGALALRRGEIPAGTNVHLPSHGGTRPTPMAAEFAEPDGRQAQPAANAPPGRGRRDRVRLRAHQARQALLRSPRCRGYERRGCRVRRHVSGVYGDDRGPPRKGSLPRQKWLRSALSLPRDPARRRRGATVVPREGAAGHSERVRGSGGQRRGRAISGSPRVCSACPFTANHGRLSFGGSRPPPLGRIAP